MSTATISPRQLTATVVVCASNALETWRASWSASLGRYLICDGVADNVEIQAALDALPVAGGSVVLSDGTFNFVAALSFTKNNLSFRGQGDSTILFVTAGANCQVIATGANIHNLYLGYFAIDGNKANQTVLANSAINFYDGGQVDYSEIAHLYIHDCHSIGISLSSYTVGGTRIHDILSRNNSRIGFRFYGAIRLEGNNLIAIGNGTDTTGTETTRSGFFLRNVTYSHLTNLIAYNNGLLGATPGYGIITFTLQYCDLSFTAYLNGQAGCLLGGDGGANESGYNNIEAILGDGVGPGIDLGQFGLGHNNVHVVINGSDQDGVYAPCPYNRITGTITGCGRGGVLLGASYNYVNVIAVDNGQDGGAADVRRAGVILDGGEGHDVQYNKIEGSILGNVVGATQRYGISVIPAGHTISNNEIVNNDFRGNTIAAIQTIDPTDKVYRQHSDLFMDVLAVSATHVRSNQDLSAATPITFTIDAQPDVPRTLSGHFDSHAQITAYTIVITGVDAKGRTVTETFTEAASPWDFETVNAYATITSIIMTARTGTGVGDTMDIGITDVLGLSNKIYATSDVYKIKKNNANALVAAAQVNVTYDTYDMAVIGLAATDDFTIYFKSNLNILA